MRAARNDGKKSSRSIFNTTRFATCGATNVLMDRALTKPCAAEWAGILSRIPVRICRCNSFNRAFGASINRMLPVAFREYPVMIVTQLWAAFPGGESFKIGEPLEFARLDPKPISERSNRLDAGKSPCLRLVNRLHSLRFAKPGLDEQLVGVSRPGALKAAVMKKKPNYVAMSRPSPAGKGFDVTLRQRPEPPPASPEDVTAASNDLLDRRFGSKKAAGEHSYKEWIGHGRQRQSTPTSHTLREPICAVAQGRSRDGFPALHVSLGYPQRGQNRTRKFDHNQA